MHSACHTRIRARGSTRTRIRRRPLLPNDTPHPPRRASPQVQHAAPPRLGTAKYSPPPQMPDDRAAGRTGSGAGSAHEEVQAEHDVRRVCDGEGDEAKEGCLCPGGCERGGEVSEAHQEGPGVDNG